MHRKFYIFIMAMAVFNAAIAFAGWEDHTKGPLKVGNQFPPHLLFLTPVPLSPRMLAKGQANVSFSMDYSSVFVNEQSRNWTVLIDMEMLVVDFAMEYGLTDYLNVSLDIPFASMGGGFLDGFLEDYHDAFGFKNYGRQQRPKNTFAYLVQKNGQELFQAKSGGFNLLDSFLSAKIPIGWEAMGEFASAALVYQIKIPTGNERRGFGGGRLDHGFFLPVQFSVKPFEFYLNPGFVLLSDPIGSGPEVSAKNLFALSTTTEFEAGDKWHLLAQLNYFSSPFEETGIDQLDADSLQLDIGIIYAAASGVDLEFVFSEDLTRAAPDFNVHVRISFALGFSKNNKLSVDRLHDS